MRPSRRLRDNRRIRRRHARPEPADVAEHVSGVWVLGTAISTLGALRTIVRLDALDDAARLAFQLALVQPIVGIVPVIVFPLP